MRRERAKLQEEQRAKKAAASAVTKPGASNAAKKPADSAPKSKPQPTTSQVQAQSQLAKTSTESDKKESTGTAQPTSEPKKDEAFMTAPVTLKLNKKSTQDGNSSSAKLKLFHHFDQYNRDYSAIDKLSIDTPNIHPAFIKFGLQSAHETISGSNSRCLAFLNSYKKFLHDYKAPNSEKKTIPEDLQSKLKTIVR